MQALVVGDEADLLSRLAAAARDVGFEPMQTTDSDAAISIFKSQFPPLVVVAWNLSQLDGLALCRQLRKYDPQHQSIVLIVTDRTSTTDFRSVLDGGADDYIVYPLDAQLLRIRLEIAARRADSRAKSARLEQQLRESVERFEFAVRGANDGLWDAQPMGEPWYRPETKVWYSPRCKELLGFRDDEFPNVLASWETRLHPDDKTRVFEALTEHIEGRQPYDVEYRLLIKSGEYRWFSARGEGIWDEQGRLMRMSGSLRDITQTKEYESRLQQGEAKWRSLVENAPDIIILADLNGTIEFINRDTPIARASIGRTTYEYIDEEHKEAMRQAFEAVRATGKTQEFEVHGQTEHGDRMLWYANRVGPIWHNGRIESVVLIGTDITDRKNAESQLQQSEAKWRSLVENAPDFIVLTDAEGTIRFVNRQTAESKRAIGHRIYDYIREPFWQETHTALTA